MTRDHSGGQIPGEATSNRTRRWHSPPRNDSQSHSNAAPLRRIPSEKPQKSNWNCQLLPPVRGFESCCTSTRQRRAIARSPKVFPKWRDRVESVEPMKRVIALKHGTWPWGRHWRERTPCRNGKESVSGATSLPRLTPVRVQAVNLGDVSQLCVAMCEFCDAAALFFWNLRSLSAHNRPARRVVF